MENINDKERLIFYKRETPYFSETSVTETRVDTNVWVNDDEPETTSSVTEDESGRTVIVETKYDAFSGVSSTTTTTIVQVPDDITKNCKLTAQDLDENFLTLKDYDIKSGYYDTDTNTIHLERNGSGLTDIVISLNGTGPEIIPDESGGTEPGGEDEPTPVDTTVHASFSGDNNNIVILNWTDSDGTPHEVAVPIYKEEKPLDVATLTPHIDKAVTKKPILGIVNSIGDAEEVYGNRYVLVKQASVRGYLYPNSTIAQINDKLLSEGLIWRVPSMSDFDILFSNQECIDNERGLALKAESGWDGYDIFGFHALPTGFEQEDEEEFDTCFYATTDGQYIKLRTANDDIDSGETYNLISYSIRLVADVSSTTIDLSDSTVNILGDDYQVKKIGSQYWITSNLNYSIGDAFPVGEYHVYLIQYDGHEWEQKQLSLGESVWMQDQSGFLSEYIILHDNTGYFLQPRFDAGWYSNPE